MANLFFAFDLVTSVLPNYVNTMSTSYSDKYFGVSTLINAFKDLDNLPIGKLTLKWGNALKVAYSKAESLFPNSAEDWPNFSSVNSFWEGFTEIFKVVKNIGRIVSANFIWLFFLVAQFMYIVTMTLNLLFSVLMFMSGHYYSVVPSHIWEDSILRIGNVITPLISAA